MIIFIYFYNFTVLCIYASNRKAVQVLKLIEFHMSICKDYFIGNKKYVFIMNRHRALKHAYISFKYL